jgi:hypothetical protein
MLSVEFACIFRGNVAIGISSVKPPLCSDLNQLASLIPGVIQFCDLRFIGHLAAGSEALSP